MFTLTTKNGKSSKINEDHALHSELKSLVSSARQGKSTDIVTLPILAEVCKTHPADTLKITGEYSHGESTFTLPNGYTVSQWLTVGNTTQDQPLYDQAVRAVNLYNEQIAQLNPLANDLGVLPVNPFVSAYAPRGRKPTGEKKEKPAVKKETKVVFA